MIESIQTHCREIADTAAQLADLLTEADEDGIPPLVLAVSMVDAEKCRAELQRVADGLMAHASPRHAEPAATK